MLDALYRSAICLLLTTPLLAAPPHRSPVALAASPDGSRLYVAEGPSESLAVWDTSAGKLVDTIHLPAAPTGLALSADGGKLYVTCADPLGWVVTIDTAKLKVAGTLRTGHGACGPSLTPDGAKLIVCCRFETNVAVIDLAKGKELGRIPAVREPIATAVAPDGQTLVIANHLPVGRADADYVSAKVTLADLSTLQAIGQIELPNGSGGARAVTISPDGKLAFVPHLLSRFHLPTTQLERGWMNTNALTIIDLTSRERINTVLLDDVDRGAANPWGVGCTADGQSLVVAHAGTHEVSVIDVPKLLEKLAKLPAAAERDPRKAPEGYDYGSYTAADVPNDLSFLVDLRRRLELPGKGPRELVVVGTSAWVGEYYSDDVCRVDLTTDRQVKWIRLAAPGAETKPAQVRWGELLFHDARNCFQSWQSCSSCHPDARADGLNWDLLNDGFGNPKNVRTMVNAHRTPPAMSLAVRGTAEDAVRAGLKNILFAVRPEAEAEAIDAYLKSLQPVPSPWLVDGRLNDSARRGQKLFERDDVGCAKCHRGRLYTDLKAYDVGTPSDCDADHDYDTPALTEVWRTAPYLHDGRAATLQDVLTTCNTAQQHGRTDQLSQAELDDLVAYLGSL